MSGVQVPCVYPFCKHDALSGRGYGSCKDGLHNSAGSVDETLERPTIGIDVCERTRGHVAPNSRLRDCWSDLRDQARIEWARDEVVRAETQLLGPVRRRNDIRLL